MGGSDPPLLIRRFRNTSIDNQVRECNGYNRQSGSQRIGNYKVSLCKSICYIKLIGASEILRGFCSDPLVQIDRGERRGEQNLDSQVSGILVGLPDKLL